MRSQGSFRRGTAAAETVYSAAVWTFGFINARFADCTSIPESGIWRFPAAGNSFDVLMQLLWEEPRDILTSSQRRSCYGDFAFSPGAAGVSASSGSGGEMFQGFPGDPDTGSRGSSSPSLESQYLSSVESFGSPPTTSAPQECLSATGGVGVGGAPTVPGAGVDMPSSFVPTVTAITTSQDLQWMVQPTLISSVAPGQSSSGPMTQPLALDPYDLPGPSFCGVGGFTPPSSDAPGPTRQSRSRRRAREETLSPEEEEKRRVRRERNKLAAAKCRNRRRELTDRLQSETDILEEEKSELEAEISELQKEKERLEFVLVAHQPGCKIPYAEQGAAPPPQPPSVSVVGVAVKEDSFYLPPAYSSHHHLTQPTQTQPQEVAFSSSFCGRGQPGLVLGEGGANPEAASYIPSYTSSFVLTYPEGGCGGGANQRSSSSDHSSDSLNSPSLLAL